MEWNETLMKLKVRRGKKLMLMVSNTAPYHIIKEKAIMKWSAFHSDVFESMEEYILLLSNCEEAQYLPGGKAEFFTLKRYKEELGRDYNKITLFLCKKQDLHQYQHIEDGSSDDSPLHLVPKKVKLEEYFQQDNQQQEMLGSIHGSIEQNLNQIDVTDYADMWLTNIASTSTTTDDIPNAAQETEYTTAIVENSLTGAESTETLKGLIKSFESKVVVNSGHFFLVIRRSSPLSRVISLWRREAAKASPEKLLRIKFLGENGIDTGALAKEFLALTVQQIGNNMFPNGVPIDSMLNVANGSFQTCGEIVAVSLAQGGPAPMFLHENVYGLMLTQDITEAIVDSFFTEGDERMLSNMENDVKEHQDIIIDHGYTGIVEDSKKEEIIATVKVSMINRRSLYLKEFCRGLSLYGIHDTVRKHPALLKKLFVLQNDNDDNVDAMYLASIFTPVFSTNDSEKLCKEEAILDNLQDCILKFEDNAISGYSEALAYKEEDDITTSGERGEKFHDAKLTPAGVLGWLTGQQHKPLNGESLDITVKFDHDCMERNPQHRICFPLVQACRNEIVIPVAHMLDKESFERNFVIAYCKGNVFGSS